MLYFFKNVVEQQRQVRMISKWLTLAFDAAVVAA